jgi:predicted house-cleaning noncanonical NTP pyrophosphatase (MazG superfamily)
MIAQTGQKCSVRVLEDGAYLAMLEEKLAEELAEFRQSKDPEELADLLEVIHALVEARGICWQELEQIRLEKRRIRGGFEKKIALLEVWDGQEHETIGDGKGEKEHGNESGK